MQYRAKIALAHKSFTKLIREHNFSSEFMESYQETIHTVHFILFRNSTQANLSVIRRFMHKCK